MDRPEREDKGPLKFACGRMWALGRWGRVKQSCRGDLCLSVLGAGTKRGQWALEVTPFPLSGQGGYSFELPLYH